MKMYRAVKNLEERTAIRAAFGIILAIVTALVAAPLLVGTVALATPEVWSSPLLLPMFVVWLGGALGLSGAWARILLPLRCFAASPVLRLLVSCCLLVGTASAVFLWLQFRHDNSAPFGVFFGIVSVLGTILFATTFPLRETAT